ncbi:ATP-binding protein [Rhizobium leguminosarum]|uniref:ATP-binding protein n=1 Tax=Rhizobium leguminosarum TaxID=384 RepID=UPI001C94ADFF|nr:ATP-binding protein [Rhizobium leguminosarum]MBY5511869.1 ATP-binding protein [Rhizobium leguminosarum]
MPKPQEARDETGALLFHTTAFETPQARLAVSRLDVKQRQWMLENLLVVNPLFTAAVDHLSALHLPYGQEGCPGSYKVWAILGESRTGKSFVCKYYTSLFPPTVTTDYEHFPVVSVTATIGMKQTEFARQLNTLTGNPMASTKGGDGAYVERAIQRLLIVDTHLVLIDDAQFLFYERRSDTAMGMFGLIKRIVDQGHVVMLVGEPKITDFVDGINAFRNRDYNPVELLALKKADKKRMAGLLDSIDKRLPFREMSGLKNYREDFWGFSKGTVGPVMNIVQDAGRRAVTQDCPHILLEHLQEAVRTRVKRDDDADYFGYKSAVKK